MSTKILSAFPNSKKVYEQGSDPTIQVPMREIQLSPTITDQSETPNAPIRVYDTSGPYTDPICEIDLHKGLPSVRHNWILMRDDVEDYEGREVKPEDNGLFFCSFLCEPGNNPSWSQSPSASSKDWQNRHPNALCAQRDHYT